MITILDYVYDIFTRPKIIELCLLYYIMSKHVIGNVIKVLYVEW